MSTRWKYALLALCFAATTAACADDRAQNADRPADTGAGTPGATGTAGTDPDPDRPGEAGLADRNFITDMIADGHAEIELSKLAQQKARNSQVKEFAQMMIRDHQKADAELKIVAQQANVDTSNVDMDHADAHERLAKLSGAEFDREYINRMVEDHEKAVNDVEDKAEDSDNEHVKQWAAKTLPTLKKHLEQARQIQNTLEKRAGV